MRISSAIIIMSLGLLLSACTIYENDVSGEVELVQSSTITVLESDFVIEDEFISVAEYGWDMLDAFTVDQGMVLAYLQFEGTSSWQALPFSVPFSNDLVNLRYGFDVGLFNLIIEGEIADNNEVNASLFHRDKLRVITIPPSAIAQGNHVDHRNYEQIVELYHLEL